ncbi:MAG: CoA transferase [Novosphingobium sp.]
MANRPFRIPLSSWADRKLALLAEETGSARIAAIAGSTLVGERGSNNRFVIRGPISAGPGGSRILATRDNAWFCLTILRDEDRAMLPALFMDEGLDFSSNEAIAAAAREHDCADLLERGRLLGLPVAAVDETPANPPIEILATGPHRNRDSGHRPLVIDLSAIWAGPLAGHLLWLAGADVVKVESHNRPDLIRRDDPATFGLINQGKANIVANLTDPAERDRLIALIRRADFVIESSRVRALQHLGVDADALVRETPGLVWLTVTGHGASGEAASWAGIGHDCGVAAGLTRAMKKASGKIGFVGDALPDPLTGIAAALEGWRTYKSGTAQRIGFAMSAIAAQALDEERQHDPAGLAADLRMWAQSVGEFFPEVPRRKLLAPVRSVGADTAAWLPC